MNISGNETLTNASSIGSLTNSFIQNISSIDLKIWYGAALVILVIIVFVYVYKKGSSPERYYRKAESAQYPACHNREIHEGYGNTYNFYQKPGDFQKGC